MRISGLHHLSLTVTDLAASAEWYRTVLGFTIDAEVEAETFERLRLRHPDHPVILTLTRHTDHPADRFDERRIGLDHLAFAVETAADVEAWERRLDELGIAHSPLKPMGTGPARRLMLTLRDPDDIQLEIIAIAP